jgi:hypothetical protein
MLNCPNPECGEKLDVDLAVSNLLLPSYPHTESWHETVVKEKNAAYRIRFRLPTGGDQEAVAALAHHDVQEAARLLLDRCVDHVTAEDDGGDPIEDWPPVVIQRLPAMMAELDPQAELLLDLTCPACGHTFSAIFDTAAYFFQEIRSRGRDLYREVHLLAFHYHWSEGEILAMTGRKRRIYLNLLAESIEQRGMS